MPTTPSPDEMWRQIQGLLGRVATVEGSFRSPITNIALITGMAGALGYHDSGDINEGPYWNTNGANWLRAWNMPWGAVAPPVVRTTGQTGISSATDLTGMTITVSATANRVWRITYGGDMTQKTSTGFPVLLLHTGASGAGTQIGQVTPGPIVANNFATMFGATYVTTSAGSTSFHLRAQTSAGTVDFNASTGSPTVLGIDDIGPSGAPP